MCRSSFDKTCHLMLPIKRPLWIKIIALESDIPEMEPLHSDRQTDSASNY